MCKKILRQFQKILENKNLAANDIITQFSEDKIDENNEYEKYVNMVEEKIKSEKLVMFLKLCVLNRASLDI